MNSTNRSFANLFLRHVLGIAIIPNLIFAAGIYGCRSGQFAGFAILGIILFIPMTLYYILPAFVAGGYGFVGQMGVGPEKLAGFIVAALFWSVISFLIVKLKMFLMNKE